MQQNCLKKGKKEVMDTGIGMIITSDTGDKSTGGMGRGNMIKYRSLSRS